MNPFTLAWANLRHQRMRTFIAVGGVSFSVVLLFMQLGFLGSVDRAATQLYDHLDFDLLLLSSEYLDLNRPGDFPRERLAQARIDGVSAVLPLTTGLNLWRDPRPDIAVRRHWNIQVLAVEPAQLGQVFGGTALPIFHSQAELTEARTALARLDTVLLDENSWPEYGGPEERRPGARGELNGRRVELAGLFTIGTGFGFNGLLLTSEATFNRATGRDPNRVTFGQVQLAPNTDAAAVRAALAHVLPCDVQAMTRAEINKKERDYWNYSTAVGRFFSLAVLVALVVGGVFLYQIMAGDIRNHLPEYATAKALGYSAHYLVRVVFAQALLLGLIGYLPGLLAALALYAVTRNAARVPIEMAAGRIVFVLVLTQGMCLASGFLAARKLQTADPADLF
jgi:putative ABC transport system permease protein